MHLSTMLGLRFTRSCNLLCIVIVIILMVLCDTKPARRKSNKGLKRGRCKPKMLAEYNLEFYGDWSPKVFNKLYPRYRPAAQWSKLVGRSHDKSYRLWTLDTFASPAVKAFAEDADSTLLDQDAQAYNGIFDSFTAAPIESGMGKSAVRFLADGKRSKVSFMVKIVPSPDWFVGVESLNLCKKGRWQNKIQIDLGPIDAGTDRGFSFTSPNWPSIPADGISQITNTYPDHPAGSFYYPNIEKLPRIGHVVLTKVAEYKRRGKNIDLTPTEPNVVIFDDEEQEEDVINIDIGNVDAALMSIRQDKPVDTQSTMQADQKALPKDCKVSEWSYWGDCSKTCGFGVKIRHRSVTQKPENGGYGCPVLSEQNTCGSMRSCRWNHFQLLSRRKG